MSAPALSAATAPAGTTASTGATASTRASGAARHSARATRHATTPAATTHPKRSAKPATAQHSPATTSGTNPLAPPSQPPPPPPPPKAPPGSPTPKACLLAADLGRVRKGTEQGVTIGNVPGTGLKDVNGMIFVDGPYRSAAQAHQSAESLQGVEFAASGGVWEVTAALRGHRGYVVVEVANCLAGHGEVKPTGGKKYKF